MRNDKKLIEIQLLDRKLQINTPQDKSEDLQKAAYYLNSKMQEVKNSGTATGNERIAIMAALNIAYELVSIRKQKDVYLDSISSRVIELQEKIDSVLAPTNEEMF